MSFFDGGLLFRSKTKTTEIFAPDGSRKIFHGELEQKLGKTTHALYSQEIIGPENDPNRRHEYHSVSYPNGPDNDPNRRHVDVYSSRSHPNENPAASPRALCHDPGSPRAQVISDNNFGGQARNPNSVPTPGNKSPNKEDSTDRNNNLGLFSYMKRLFFGSKTEHKAKGASGSSDSFVEETNPKAKTPEAKDASGSSDSFVEETNPKAKTPEAKDASGSSDSFVEETNPKSKTPEAKDSSGIPRPKSEATDQSTNSKSGL